MPIISCHFNALQPILFFPHLEDGSDSDFTPALRSGPDIAADAEAAALIRVLYPLTHVGPPPILSQRYLHLFTRFTCQVLPVVVLVALIFVVYSCCIVKILQTVA